MAEHGSRQGWESGVGVTLRAERLRQALDLQAVAKTLNVRQPFLQAIEDGRYEELPGPTYAAGFVRAYAEHLDLDSEQAVRQFKRETLGRTIGVELNFPAPERERGTPKWPILVASVLLLAVLYGAWYLFTPEGDGGDVLVAAVPERLAPQSEGEPSPAALSLPATVEPQDEPSAVALPLPATVEPPPEAPQPTLPDEGADMPAASSTPVPDPDSGEDHDPADVAAVPTGTDAATPVAEDLPAEAGPPSSVEDVADGSSVMVVPVDPASHGNPDDGSPDDAAPLWPEPAASATPRIDLRALADSWISVRDADGRVVIERILPAGEVVALAANSGQSLTTGNAGGLEISLDGEVLPSLGPPGAVRRGIALEAAALRPAPTSPPPAVDTAAATDPVAFPAPPAPEAPDGDGGGGEGEGAETGRVVLRATAETWIQVRSDSGRVLVSRLLPAGESVSVDTASEPSLMTGNAGGLEIILDGEVMPALGGPGEVRRGILLTPTALRAGAEP